MNKVIAAALLSASIGPASIGTTATATAADFPSWAYPVLAPGAAPTAQGAPDDGTLRHVPNSTVGLTLTQIAGRDVIPDWHPDSHPPAPDIVSKGHPPAVRACGFCHLPDGAGRPENARLAGLPVAYIKQQVINFRNGDRKGSEPKRQPQTMMMAFAKAATDDDIAQAAAYFSALKPASFITVVESATAPKTIVADGMMAKVPNGGAEPLGNRIIEVPDNYAFAEDRDAKTNYTAYVPKGSIAKGATLVTTGGNGKTIPCAICHGADLHGIGDVPRIAGLSPSYLTRQLYDIQTGTRAGSPALMQQVVAKLDNDDIIAIAAYVATRAP